MSEASHEAVESRPKPHLAYAYVVLTAMMGVMGARGRGDHSTCAVDRARPTVAQLDPSGAARGLIAGALLFGSLWAIQRRAFRRADGDGLVWRNEFGRQQSVPWREVIEVRHVVGGRDGREGFTEVSLGTGQCVRLNTAWDGAEALFRRVARGASRGPYRTDGNEGFGLILFAYGSPYTRSEWRFFPLLAGFWVVVVAVLFASKLPATLHYLRHDAPSLGALLALGGVVAIGALIRRQLDARNGWCDAVLAVDPRGIDVRGGAAPRQIPWCDVRAIVADGAAVRLDTASGPLAVLPGLDGGALFLHLVLREAPPEVAARHRRDGFTRQRLEPTERPDGTRRHHAKTRWHRHWLLLLASPLITLVLCAGALRAAMGSLAEWAVIATVSGPILLAILATYAAWMARFHVTVSPEGCTWQGLLTRRTFRWGDVAEAVLHGDDPRKLALKLRDRTTLDCDPRHIADGDLLVTAVRRHVPHAVREAP